MRHLIAGRLAVVIFFILSGFVLALPYLNGTQQSYGKYIIRRICRIYLPFAATVLLAAFLCHTIGEPRPLWAEEKSWLYPVDLKLILSHLMMTGVHPQSISLDGPMWSLIFEMRASILFPLLVILVVRFNWLAVLGGSIIGLIAVKIAFRGEEFDMYVGNNALETVALTMYYIAFFLLGIMMAKRREQLKSLMLKIPRNLHILFLLIIIFMPYILIKDRFSLKDAWYALTASYLILCCISFDSIKTFLSISFFKWLGKISYSLYLIHTPVLLAVLYLLHDTLPIAIIVAIILPLTLLAAEIMHITIEKPSMILGKRLAK